MAAFVGHVRGKCNILRIRQAIYQFIDDVIELIWPPNHCLLCCGLIPATDLLLGVGLCQHCRHDLAAYNCCPNCATFIHSNATPEQLALHHRFCHSSQVQGIAAFNALAPYAGQMRQNLLQLKYHGQRRLAKPLGQEIARAWQHTGWPADVIIPVPLHAEKMKQRGYNQCDLLSKACGEVLNLPVLSNVLQRVKATEVQNKLNAEERKSNVESAFACEDGIEQLAGKNIILLDDIITTGSTMRACAVALQSARPAAIYGLAVAGKLLQTESFEKFAD